MLKKAGAFLRKYILIAAPVAMIALCGMGGIFAYLIADAKAVNTATVGEAVIELNQSGSFPAQPAPGTATSSSNAVTVKNTGSVPVYVRMKFVCSSKALYEHTTLEGLPGDGWNASYSDVIGMNSTYSGGNSMWGYFYYEKPLKPGESTPPLFTGVSIGTGTDDLSLLNYKMDVYAEAVQQGGFTDYELAWRDFVS